MLGSTIDSKLEPYLQYDQSRFEILKAHITETKKDTTHHKNLESNLSSEMMAKLAEFVNVFSQESEAVKEELQDVKEDLKDVKKNLQNVREGLQDVKRRLAECQGRIAGCQEKTSRMSGKDCRMSRED